MSRYFRIAHFYAKVLVMGIIAGLAAAIFGNLFGGSVHDAKVLFIGSFAIVFGGQVLFDLAHGNRS